MNAYQSAALLGGGGLYSTGYYDHDGTLVQTHRWITTCDSAMRMALEWGDVMIGRGGLILWSRYVR